MYDVEVTLPDASTPEAIIVDIDGTLALIGDRDPYDASESFYDELNHPIYRLMMKYWSDGYKIIIMTGRSAEYYAETKSWLDKHRIPHDMLIMRAKGDRRPDTLMKLQAYNSVISVRFSVELVIEDRGRVVRMWRSQGLTCVQVAEGDF